MLEYPKLKDMTPNEQAEVIELILAHLGRKIQTFKMDGESERSVNLVKDRD